MEKVKVQLIGSPQTEVGERAVKFPYRKTAGIFYYLCVKKQVTRDELVNVFWADTDEKSGKKNVRQVLYQLKKCLGEDILKTQGNSVLMLNPELPLEIDWDLDGEEFLSAEGEFLQFFYIKECPEFEDWMEEMRVLQKERWDEEIRRQLSRAEIRTDEKRLHQLIRRWVQADPLSEKTICTAMEYYADQGQYNLAIQLFYEYRDRLIDELEEEPGDDILRMFHRIFQIKETSMGRLQEEDVFYARSAEVFRINDQVQRFKNREECISQVICGHLGVGKSALMERIMNMNRGSSLLRLSCHSEPSDREFYLRSWGNILRQLERMDHEEQISLMDDQRQMIAKILHGTETENEAVFVSRNTFPMMENRLRNLFRSLAEQYRVMLFIDDIQWMDSMSCHILRSLMEELGNRGLFLLVTCRTDDSGSDEGLVHYMKRRRWIETIDLEPFSEEETASILHEMIPELCTGDVIDNIYRRTEGNALILMDFLEVIQRDGSIPDHIPEHTGQVLELQLRQLSPEQMQLLQVISMFMDSADISEIRVLMHKDVLTIYEILESLQQRHLIREEILGENYTYRFRHKAYHEYIYQNQSQGKRRLWHQLIAEHYERQRGTASWFELLPYLIYQYGKSGNERKAEQYKVQYYCEFYALSNENFPVLRTNMEYDEVAVGMSDNEQEILAAARRILNEDLGYDNLMLAECHFLIGRSAIARGQYAEGLSHIHSCIYMCETAGNPALLLGAYRQLIFYGIQVDERNIMDKYICKGLAVLEDKKSSPDYATFLRLRGLYECRCECWEQAMADLQEAYRIFSSLRNAECQYHLSRAACINYMGKIYLKKGAAAQDRGADAREDFAKAEEYFRRAIETGVCQYITNGMGQFRSNLGQCLLYQGRLKDAEKSFRDALSCFSCHEGFFWGWDRAEAFMVMVCSRLGLKTEAMEHLEQARKMIPVIANPMNIKLLADCEGEMAEFADSLKRI